MSPTSTTSETSTVVALCAEVASEVRRTPTTTHGWRPISRVSQPRIASTNGTGSTAVRKP